MEKYKNNKHKDFSLVLQKMVDKLIYFCKTNNDEDKDSLWY